MSVFWASFLGTFLSTFAFYMMCYCISNKVKNNPKQ